MNQALKYFNLSASALAACVVISACGGGAAEPPTNNTPPVVVVPGDTTAPTVSITSNAGVATATGPVTFTFTFSEDVGTSFTLADITVAGGTAGQLTKVDATHYTLVVTPPANSSGTINVDVAASVYTDAAGNGGAVAQSALHAYSTAVPVAISGNTGACTAATCIDFSGAITFGIFENVDGTVAVAADPKDAANKVAKFVKTTTDKEYFGTVINGGLGSVVLTAANKTVTMRVLSPALGTNMLLKFEGGANGAVTEMDVVTTKANEWETLTFVLPAAGTYSTVVLFPNGRSLVTANKEIYVDEIKFPAVSAPAPAPVSGNTGTCTAAACIDFSGAITFGIFENVDGTVAVAADPKDAANKVAKFVKTPTDKEYFGTVINGGPGPVVLTAANKTVTMRVLSPAVGANMLLKFEGGAGGAITEMDVVTTKANEWETLTFVLPAAGTYSTVVLFPNGRSVVTANKEIFVDEIKFPAVGAPVVAGTSNLVNGVFANNYTGATEPAWASAQGGTAGRYIDGSVATQDWWNGVAAPTDTVRSFYFGYGISSAAKPWGFGGYVKAPANGTAIVSAFTSVNVSVWGNSELFSKNPNVTLILKGAAAAGCTPELQGIVAANSINATSYVVAKSSLTVKTPCGALSTTDSIWAAGVNEVHFQVLGANVQYITGTAPDYANGLNIGPIVFQ